MPRPKRSPAPPELTLADVELVWQDDAERRERRLPGADLAVLIQRHLFLGRTDPGETPLWQARLRGLAALMYPEAGISIHESDGRALVGELLEEATAALGTEGISAQGFARKIQIRPKGSRS